MQAAYGSGPWGRNVRTPRDATRPAPLLRRAFDVTGRVRNATLFYAAGGYADFTVNGKRASDDVLTPGFTDYDDTVQYTTADLTDQLKRGANTLGAELGRGFYGMTGGNVWRWESPPWHDEPVVRARLRIEYEDGRVQDVITDDAWQIADGPTVFDDLYAGETYDARLRHADAPGRRRARSPGPKGVLVNQRQQPIRVTESLRATEITEPAPDVYVVKFPRVLAGWVEFNAQRARRHDDPRAGRREAARQRARELLQQRRLPVRLPDRPLHPRRDGRERALGAAVLLQGLPVHRGHRLAGRRAAAARARSSRRPCTRTSTTTARSRAPATS